MPRALVVVLLALVAPSSAGAAALLTPTAGETIASRPGFRFDFAAGTARVELSRSPDVRVGGDTAGAFVEAGRSASFVFGGPRPSPSTRPDGTATWPSSLTRINAGRWFLHALVNASSDGRSAEYTPVIEVFVADDRPSVQGLVARPTRLERTRTCAYRARVRTTVAYDDNDALERAKVVFTFRIGGRVVQRVAAQGRRGRAVATATLCRSRRPGRFSAGATVTDPAGQRASAPARVVALP